MGREGKFNEERLFKIRRMRKARRLFKQMPLFAFVMMQAEYSGYSLVQFQDDLRRRSKPKPKKKGKSPLARFGRYWRIQQLIARYSYTQDESLIIKAMKLRQRITKPYRLEVRLKGMVHEITLSPMTPIQDVESLIAKFNLCKTEKEIDRVFADFQKLAHLR
ncbi:hypothetical protein [Pedobacter sp. GR22-10]|uniref:hypothetical protein n=1 Tax=Pedobacter sp. GR22-10 TaxID=2994472 RepID=UPI002245A21C|nr:hypothetical protein [Pedobacter sp. GR22-10]MCX2429875.1 hypothetical protein [Pedobacter sp. GR22-10]